LREKIRTHLSQGGRHEDLRDASDVTAVLTDKAIPIGLTQLFVLRTVNDARRDHFRHLLVSILANEPDAVERGLSANDLKSRLKDGADVQRGFTFDRSVWQKLLEEFARDVQSASFVLKDGKKMANR